MIYYSNSALDKPHMTFIGRWSPFHKGHTAIMFKKMAEHPELPILVMVRNTTTDAYPAVDRAEYIKIWMKENRIHGTIMIIPNVEGVYWGRGVGYNTGIITVDEAFKDVSATAIRKALHEKSPLWTKNLAHPDSAYMLSPNIGSIIEHGLVVWLTGCPSSGKSTISRAFIEQVRIMYPYLKVQLLDGDEMRASPLAHNVGFTSKDRAAHILRMAYLAKMFADHGVLVVCAFVSPERKIRTEAKKLIGKDRFTEIYVQASRKTRIKRDTNGVYKKALAGKLQNVTGYDAGYEPPLHPNAICDTDRISVKDAVGKIMNIILKET